jgi:hypothetical protein
MKSQASSLKQSLVISVYITACYYALMGSEARTARRCYNILTGDPAVLNRLVQEGVDEYLNVG